MTWEAMWISVRIAMIGATALLGDLLADQKGWRGFVPPLAMLAVFQRLFDPAAPRWPHPAAAFSALGLWLLALGARERRWAPLRCWALLASGLTCISLELT